MRIVGQITVIGRVVQVQYNLATFQAKADLNGKAQMQICKCDEFGNGWNKDTLTLEVSFSTTVL